MYGLFDYNKVTKEETVIDLYDSRDEAFCDGQQLYDQDEHDGDNDHLYLVKRCSENGVPCSGQN